MTTTSSEWLAILQQYMDDRLSVGDGPATVSVTVRRLHRLRDELGADPLRIPADQLAAYLAEIDQRYENPATRKAQRLAVRRFYRWAHATGRRPDQPVNDTPRVRVLSAAWQAAVDDFLIDQRSLGINPSTVAQRMKYLRKLAAYASRPPFLTAHADVQRWLDSLGVSPASRLAHRSAARAFYRWATATGRVFADPMALTYNGPARRAVPPVWESQIIAYRSFVRAGGRAESSVATYLDVLRAFARAHSHVDPFAVTMDDVSSWMGNKRWARETRRRNRQTLLGFYRWAVTTARAEMNPVEQLPLVRAESPHARPAADDEYADALAAASPSDRLALRLAAELGMRRGEVARVHSRDVRGTRGAFELVVLGKGGKHRTLPLPDELGRTLLDQGAGYVFPGGDGGHVSPRWLGRRISRLLPTGTTMHQLRHRFATRAYSIDRDLFGVQTLLGHASPATTRGYVRIPPASLRRIVEGVAS